MAWETRGSNRRYFYLNQRLPDGRVRKRYFGNGLLAEAESLRLEQQAAVRRQIRSEARRVALAESLTKQHQRSTSDVVHALMLNIGFTNERSRGWRPLRMIAPNDQPACDGNEDVAALPADQFPDLVQKARQGDRSVIPALRRMMQANPGLAKANGDLATRTQIKWIDLIAGQDLYFRECLLMKMGELKRKLLADTNGTIVEQMLVDQAIATWLQVHFHETREATDPAENIKLGEFRLRKIESSFSRHLKSLNALASLRAINFTNRMADSMTKVIPDAATERRKACFKPVTYDNCNRIGNAFNRSLEPAPMN